MAETPNAGDLNIEKEVKTEPEEKEAKGNSKSKLNHLIQLFAQTFNR